MTNLSSYLKHVQSTFFGFTSLSRFFLILSKKCERAAKCFWDLWRLEIYFSSLDETLQTLSPLNKGVCLLTEWAAFCILSFLRWGDTRSPPCTCWRTRTFSTGGNAQAFIAHISHTEEVGRRHVFYTEVGSKFLKKLWNTNRMMSVCKSNPGL